MNEEDKYPNDQVYVSMGSTDNQERGFEIGQLFTSSPPTEQLRQRRNKPSKSTKNTVAVQETLFDLERNDDESEDGSGNIHSDESRERQSHLKRLKATSLKESMDEFLKLSATESQPYNKAPRNKSNASSGGSKSFDLSPYERLENFIEEEFPTKDQQPSQYELINIGHSVPNRNRYKPGDWVEVEGLDMRWRVDMITRVIKKSPDDWDWNAPQNEGKEPQWTFTYNAGDERNIDEEDLRSPKEGLKLVFGSRPWVWQQWAILKVEEKLRFQEGHQDDFMEKDIQKLATDLWDQWLDHPDNAAFKAVFEDERIGDLGRSELETHIQKPFNLIDRIGEENDEWDFQDDPSISVFTYLSCLGSGYLTVLFVLLLQILLPAILVVSAFDSNALHCKDDAIDEEGLLAKVMTVVVFAYYLVSVIPDTYVQFFDVSGTADTVFSRVLSLRRILWLQADDTIGQMFGYRFDIYMNTSYVCILSMINIYVLTQTNEALEVVLNALAFIFIDKIDEEAARAAWYDPKKRWISAGVMGLVMQTTIDLRSLSSSALFAKKFDVDEKRLMEACEQDPYLFQNKRLAKKDSRAVEFMSDEERIQFMCGTIAENMGNHHAIEEYRKQDVYFGSIETFLGSWSRANAMFERMTDYRTWSRWEKVLFLSPVPDLDDIFHTDAKGVCRVKQELKDHQSSNDLKYSDEQNHQQGWVRFLRYYIDVLIFRDAFRAMRPAWQIGKYKSLLVRFIDGFFFNWISFILFIIFPLYYIGSCFEVGYNVITQKCFSFIGHLLEWAGFPYDNYYG